MRCAHCPVGGGRCPGEAARRLCELVDPAHPDHRPGYRDSIAAVAAQHRAGGVAYPSAVDMARGLARSLWDWAVGGFGMADEAEVSRRLAICAGCPQWDAEARRCRICGCNTDAKVRLRTAHCPLPVPKW